MFQRLALQSAPDLGSHLSYDAYSTLLDSLSTGKTASVCCQAGIFDDIKQLGLTGALASLFTQLKTFFTELATDFQLGAMDVITAFKQRDIYALLRAIGFNLSTLTRMVQAALGLFKAGLFNILEDVAKSGFIEDLKKGVVKVDAILEKYPLLKRLSGPALAGFLFWMWLNSSFTGDARYDFDIQTVIDALKGEFQLAELFLSHQGLVMLSVFALGFTGVSFPWLGASLVHILAAMTFMGLRKAGASPAVRTKLHALLPGARYV